MQLIHETQPTEDIHINMSIQAENPVHCDKADIKREINHANKENNPIMDDKSTSLIEKSINVEIEATKQTILNQENPLNSNMNGSESNYHVDNVLKDDQLDNYNNKVLENTSNGLSDSCIIDEINCDNTISETSKEFEGVNLFKSDENVVENVSSSVEISEHLKPSENGSLLSDVIAENTISDVEMPGKPVEVTFTENNVNVQETKSTTREKETTKDTTTSTGKILPEINCTSTSDANESLNNLTDAYVHSDSFEETPINIPEKCMLVDTNEETPANIPEPSGVDKERPINITDPCVDASNINKENNDDAAAVIIDVSFTDTCQQNVISKIEDPSTVKNILTKEDEPCLDDSKKVEDDTLANDTFILEDISSSDTCHQDLSSKTEEIRTEQNISSLENKLYQDTAVNDRKDTSSNETCINSTERSIDITRAEDILLDEEMNDSSQEFSDCAVNLPLKIDTITNENVEANSALTVDVLCPEDGIVQEMLNRTTTSADITSNSESNSLDDINIKESKTISSLNDNNIDVIMDDFKKANANEEEKELTLLSTGSPITVDEDKVINKDEKELTLLSTVKPIIADEEKETSSVEETLKYNDTISTKVESSASFNITDYKTLPSNAEDNDIAMIEPVTTVHKDQVDPNTEIGINDVQENDESVAVDIKNKRKDLMNVEDEDDVVMEIDDVEIIDLDKGKSDSCESTLKSIVSKLSDAEIKELDPTSINENEVNNIFNEDIESADRTKKSENENITKDLVEHDENAQNMEILDEDDITLVEKTAQTTSKQQETEIPLEQFDEDDITLVEKTAQTTSKQQETEIPLEQIKTKTLPVVCKLSNTLDILSDDDEEEPSKVETELSTTKAILKQCINIDDDDDIMLIEDDANSKETISSNIEPEVPNEQDDALSEPEPDHRSNFELREEEITTTDIRELSPNINEKDSSAVTPINPEITDAQTPKISEVESEKIKEKKPLLPRNVLKTAKKNLAEMTRDELEEFCILRIVEGIVDRSNLSDIKSKIKTMAQNLEDFRKKATMLSKQNRDLQVVLKSVQEEQKNRISGSIQPLKITRSVGMQVLMNDKLECRKKGPITGPPVAVPVSRPIRPPQNVKNIKPPSSPVPIPVPRKVPVNNSPAKILTNPTALNIGKIPGGTIPNGIRNVSPVQKMPEKRTYTRLQSISSSVTVDLTDDEPPAKVSNVTPVRVVPPQNLMPQQRPPFSQPLNSPRKVYIPISGPQGQSIRPGPALIVKGGPSFGPRQRLPGVLRMQQTQIRVQKPVPPRHPAPLPDAAKQYTPPTWKSLPPAPDLKLSKVENGIVISWKIDGYPEGGYETIASYQLYAYQETTSPPSTALWKKIGDVKALPLPMACTLTQFMAGFKYYFAVRAVDVRSRLGPFSLPGSILLLNKV